MPITPIAQHNWMRARSNHNGSSMPSSMSGSMDGSVKSMSASAMELVAVGLVILTLYILVGGFDLLSTMSNTEQSFRAGEYIDVIATGLFYLLDTRRCMSAYPSLLWIGEGDYETDVA